MKILVLSGLLLFASCKREPSMSSKGDLQNHDDKVLAGATVRDSIVRSKEHHFKDISCDMDGDKQNDVVQIVQNRNNLKYGLKIRYGNGRVDYLGMGKEFAGQGFDDFVWIGVFEKVGKGVYWSNISTEGEILTDQDVIREEDKIRLDHDGIFVHQGESCGGGIIYYSDGEYHWIQQE